MNPTKPCLWKQAPVTETESDSAFEKTHWILPASAVWFINFNLTSHELSLDTIGFSRVEFRPILLEKDSWRLKLKLHAAEADGICDHPSAIHLGSS